MSRTTRCKAGLEPQLIPGRLVADLVDPLPFTPGQADLLEGFLNVDFQVGKMKRLGEIIIGTRLHGLDGGLHAAVGGQHQGLQLRLTFLELAQKVDAGAVGQVQVQEGNVKLLLLCFGKGVGKAGSGGNCQALLAQAPLQGFAEVIVVIHNQ